MDELKPHSGRACLFSGARVAEQGAGCDREENEEDRTSEALTTSDGFTGLSETPSTDAGHRMVVPPTCCCGHRSVVPLTCGCGHSRVVPLTC